MPSTIMAGTSYAAARQAMSSTLLAHRVPSTGLPENGTLMP